MASRTYRAEAIVLRTVDFGEADRILVLFSRHFGKLHVVAKGIRRATSRMAGHAEPLTHATYQLARGRELDVLETALRHLDAGHAPALVCRWFDLHLLDRSGFRPELYQCVVCRAALQERQNAWSAAAGGALCQGCASRGGVGLALSVRALKSLRYLLQSDFAGAVLLRVDAPLSTELEHHMRFFVQHVIDREITAARLIDEIRALPSPAS